MKVGDLVKLLEDPEVQRNNREIPTGSVGVIVKVDSRRPVGFLTSAWVQWFGLSGQSALWIKELEVISESG